MTKSFIFSAALAAAVGVAAACTHQNEAPGLTGPSGFSTSALNKPSATFTIAPYPIDLSRQPGGGKVTFDASGSCGVQFSANGACQSPVVDFRWSFSNGDTKSGPVVEETFSDDVADTTITVVLIVTNSEGVSSTSSQSAQVRRSPPPKASGTFAPNPAVLSAAGSVTVVFTDTSTVVAPRFIQKSEWDFLDGQKVTGSSAQHVFSEEGTFPVVLTVTDDLGQQQTSVLSVSVTAPTP